MCGYVVFPPIGASIRAATLGRSLTLAIDDANSATNNLLLNTSTEQVVRYIDPYYQRCLIGEEDEDGINGVTILYSRLGTYSLLFEKILTLNAVDLLTLRKCNYEYILYSNNGVTVKYASTVNYQILSSMNACSASLGIYSVASTTGFRTLNGNIDLVLLDAP